MPVRFPLYPVHPSKAYLLYPGPASFKFPSHRPAHLLLTSSSTLVTFYLLFVSFLYDCQFQLYFSHSLKSFLLCLLSLHEPSFSLLPYSSLSFIHLLSHSTYYAASSSYTYLSVPVLPHPFVKRLLILSCLAPLFSPILNHLPFLVLFYLFHSFLPLYTCHLHLHGTHHLIYDPPHLCLT